MILLIKKIIRSILHSTITSISLFFSLNNIYTFRKYKNIFYSSLLKREFKDVGENFSIEYPFNIIGPLYISIGNNFSSFSGLILEAHEQHLNNHYSPEIKIGDNVSFAYNCHIGCVNKIIIGNNVLFASKVFVTDHFHGEIKKEFLKIPPSLRKVISKGPVIIEDNVWIGEGVAIMPNVKIGRNTIIGTNSVVTKNIPENSVVGGVPAKVIRKLE